MTAHDFKCDICGRIFEQRHSIRSVPQEVPCEDASCTGTAKKQLSFGAMVDTREMDKKFPYVSTRLPRNLKGCQTTSDGKAVIMSRQHEDQVFKKHGYERE